MMNIEQLAIEHELMVNIELYGEFKDNEMLLKARREKLKKLEAFAKALQQQSEPVAIVHNAVSCATSTGKYNTINTCLPAGTELFTQPPKTVSLEQYNKVVDGIRNALYQDLNDIKQHLRKLIAEAERSAK